MLVRTVDQGLAERLVLGVEQRGVHPYPLAIAAARDQLEAGRPAAVEEHPGQLALLPAPAEVRGRADKEQLQRVDLPAQPRHPNRLCGPMLLAGLVVVEQREVEIGLAAEVVIETADTRAGPGHDVGDVRVGEPARRERVARR